MYTMNFLSKCIKLFILYWANLWKYGVRMENISFLSFSNKMSKQIYSTLHNGITYMCGGNTRHGNCFYHSLSRCDSCRLHYICSKYKVAWNGSQHCFWFFIYVLSENCLEMSFNVFQLKQMWVHSIWVRFTTIFVYV